MPAIGIIVTIIFIVIIVFVVLQYKTTAPKSSLKGPVDLWDPKPVVLVSRTDTNKYMKGNWTLSFYLRIDAVPDMRSAVPFLIWPGSWTLSYNPAQENMVWTLYATPDGNLEQEMQTLTIPSVPMQKWTQVMLAQEGRTMDMYVNGRLIKTDQLTNLPKNTSGSITISPTSLMGEVAFVQMWSRRLTGGEISSNYADSSDSQGRPLLGPALFQAFKGLSLPNIFCPGGDCTGKSPSAQPSQIWEFPYA